MRARPLRLAAYLMIGATVLLAVVLASGFGADPGLVDSPLLGKPAPEFELQRLDGGGTTSLADLRGDIVVINFFASWCLECRKEHADLVATADAFADQGVSFVQISYQEDPDITRAYLVEAGAGVATMYLMDSNSRTAIAYGVFGIPETFFVDREGRVVGKIIGETNALLLGATIDAITRGEEPGQQITGDTQKLP